jgi:hypothetical protein
MYVWECLVGNNDGDHGLEVECLRILKQCARLRDAKFKRGSNISGEFEDDILILACNSEYIVIYVV